MAEETLEQRLAKLYAKRDFVDRFNEDDVKTLIDAIRDAREHGGTASVDITPISGGGGYTITITDSEGTEHTATVKDGGDAYEVYVSTVPQDQTPMSKAEWLASLKGDTGNDGSDGHNPCLGRFNVLPTLSPNPFADARNGDYIYFDTTDSQTSEPVTYIYHFDGTNWDAQGTVVDVSNLTFNSGESVPGTSIDGTGLANPAGNALAKAEDVLRISTKFSLVGNGNTSVKTGVFGLVKGNYRIYVENPNIALTGVSGASNLIFYVKNNRTNEYSVFVRYADAALQQYYDFVVETTDQYFIGMRAMSGERQVFTIVSLPALEAIMPDVYYKYINQYSNIEDVSSSSSFTYGIRHIKMESGMAVMFHTEMPSSNAPATPYCRFVGADNSVALIYACTANSATREDVGIFVAPQDGVLELSFDYTLNNWYRMLTEEELEFMDEKDGLLYPLTKFGYRCIFYNSYKMDYSQISYAKNSSSGIVTIFFKVPPELRGLRIFFKPTNSAYTVTRVMGMKRKSAITKSIENLTYTDSFGNVCICATDAINTSDVDEIAFNFRKNDGYTDEEYLSFALENPYGNSQKFKDIRNVPNMIHERYYPVGSIVNYQRRGFCKIVKEKPANSWGEGCLSPISLIDTDNIPLENSHAEIANVMNVISANVGATNSNWKNAYGGRLFSVNQCYNRTTAKDMVRLMIAATKYPEFIAIMGTETATVHIYGEHDRDKTLKNVSWDKIDDAYEALHGSGAVMPYSIVCVKPGATVATDGTDTYGNIGYATGNDGISNTGFAMVGIAKIGDKYVAFDAANVSSANYTNGRLARAKATIELLDTCKTLLEGGSAAGTYSYLERGAAAIIENPIAPYCVNNTKQSIEFLYEYNGDTLFQPASTSKLVGGLAILSVLSNMEEYHSIWGDSKELINDSGADTEGHVAQAGDVESVRTSLCAMMLVSNGANTLSLARMAGEKIIRSKNKFLDLTLGE